MNDYLKIRPVNTPEEDIFLFCKYFYGQFHGSDSYFQRLRELICMHIGMRVEHLRDRDTLHWLLKAALHYNPSELQKHRTLENILIAFTEYKEDPEKGFIELKSVLTLMQVREGEGENMRDLIQIPTVDPAIKAYFEEREKELAPKPISLGSLLREQLGVAT